jgi:uncharacterized protein YcfJ
MKKLLLLSTAMLAGGLSMAQEVGRVISATPIIQQVNAPRQVCTTESVAVQQPKSGAGALMGAIAGGAMGNAIGGGAGKAAATVLGLVGGAAIGDRLEGGQTAQIQNAQHCTTQNFVETRPVAYNVIYEFGGKQYSVQMPTDPGPTVQLQISPVGSSAQTAQAPANATYAQPVYEQPDYVVVAPPVYPGYYQSGYYQPGYYQPNYIVPFALGLGFGYWGGYGGHGHGHWR